MFTGVVGLWIPGFLNAVWRASLQQRAAGLEKLGLEIRPSLGPKIRAYGYVDGHPVKVHLRGGLRGERIEIHAGPEHIVAELRGDPADLVRELLSGRSRTQSPDPS